MQQQPTDPHVSVASKKSEEKLEEKMHQLALKEKEQQTQMTAYAAGLPYISLVGMPIPPGPLSIIPEDDAKKFKIVCFAEIIGEFRVAVTDPAAEGLMDYLNALAEKTSSKITIFVMSETSFASVEKLYKQLPKIRPEVEGVQITQDDLDKYGEEFSDIRKLNELLAGVTLTEIITVLIAVALKTRSSDVHIEAEEKDVKVRLRVDGILHDIASLPASSWPRIISRIKLVSGLKINVADRPQDGRFTIFLKEDKVDVRVSTLPTSYGESVVMRLLRSSAAGLQFEQLGLSAYNEKLLKAEIEKPNGMIITTGPTGSGKTTTLYAILNYLNSPDIKIITLEDPVEYKLAGINQSQIDASRNYTFAAGLRSILRQDPDIVMVGEIRDLETAEIAINAALTGHVVISTIHTNSAAGAIPRFLAMGVKGFLLAPAMNAIMGQRLVRRLCVECKQEVQPEQDAITRVKKILTEMSPASGIQPDVSSMHFFGPKGCDVCHGLGYKGRVGIYEIMAMCPEIEAQILSSQVSEYTIQDIAVKNGMITMVQDGLLRVLEGVTSLDEVFSVAD
ncbi:type II/IV secretion system protein [Candidatus Uhrbacteria bacterium]|nr:type II/IV secretion system protein [Candidatus Uhrbacteria bacterium]